MENPSVTIHRHGPTFIVKAKGKNLKNRIDSNIFSPDSMLESISFMPLTDDLLIKTLNGKTIKFNIPIRQSLSVNAPVIYLDQVHWSTLSKVDQYNVRIPPLELAAAREIINMANNGKIILPLAQVHFLETLHWTDSIRRQKLAIQLLQLSKGWTMRHPLSIRRNEIIKAVSGSGFNNSEPEFGFLAHDLISIPGTRSGYSSKDVTDESVEIIASMLTEVIVYIDILTSSDFMEKDEAHDWVKSKQNNSNDLHALSLTKEEFREKTDKFFLDDINGEVNEAFTAMGLTVPEAKKWLDKEIDQFSVLPIFGIWREAFHDKYSDPSTEWENNDLNDLMYLTCGAAYADILVGEKSLTHIMSQSLKRLNRPVNVYKNLRTALPEIEQLISRDNYSEDS